MLDEGIFSWLTDDVIYAMNSQEWLTAAFHIACDGIAVGKAEVVSIKNGNWRISCESMQTVASLSDSREVRSRIFQLSRKRQLPNVTRLTLIPPMGVGTPLAMLHSIPYRKMPEPLWLKFAWKMAVDPETSRTSELIGVKNGVWQVRCYSDHAWRMLQNPKTTINMLNWLSSLRKLPEIKNIQPFLGAIVTECVYS